MNDIAICKEKELLDYLDNGLENSPDTPMARYKQQLGLKVFKGTERISTKKGMQKNEYFQIYHNTGYRTRYYEYSRVSLTSKERKD